MERSNQTWLCKCKNGNVVLRTSCRDHSYGQRYYACPNSKPGTTERGCGYFMWMDASPGPYRYYACPNSKPGTTERGCGYFMWMDASPGPLTPQTSFLRKILRQVILGKFFRPSHSPRSDRISE
ncbi:F-box domain containing protein [Tanacetum coccineum]